MSHWKLVFPKKQKTPMLFGLSKDIGETTDLASKHPEKVKDLSQRYQAWDVKMRAEAEAVLGE